MEIRIVRSAVEKSDALLIRKVVFMDEQKVPEHLEIDEHEDEAIHFVGYLDHQPVAASRLRFVGGRGKLERICVLKEHRGKSYGKQLIDEMERVVHEHKVNQTTLNAQVQAIPFYEKLGYEVVSEEFMDAGIPHVTMEKKLF